MERTATRAVKEQGPCSRDSLLFGFVYFVHVFACTYFFKSFWLIVCPYLNFQHFFVPIQTGRSWRRCCHFSTRPTATPHAPPTCIFSWSVACTRPLIQISIKVSFNSQFDLVCLAYLLVRFVLAFFLFRVLKQQLPELRLVALSLLISASGHCIWFWFLLNFFMYGSHFWFALLCAGLMFLTHEGEATKIALWQIIVSTVLLVLVFSPKKLSDEVCLWLNSFL